MSSYQEGPGIREAAGTVVVVADQRDPVPAVGLRAATRALGSGQVGACDACGARRYLPQAETRCIPCLAGAAGKRNWSAAEDDVLYDTYGMMLPEAIQRELFRRTGSPRSCAGIITRAGALHIDHRTNQALWSIPEVTEALGISQHIVYGWIEAGRIKSRGRGKCILVDPADVERLREAYPQVPFERTCSRPELMRRLGYSETHASRLLTAGVIRALKRGGRWYVDAEHVDEIEREMKSRGAVKLSLPAVPVIEKARQQSRDYQVERRRRRRQLRTTVFFTMQQARRALGVRIVGLKELRLLLEAGLVHGEHVPADAAWLVDRKHVAWLAGRPQLIRALVAFARALGPGKGGRAALEAQLRSLAAAGARAKRRARARETRRRRN